jgi:hypothetical protein
MAVPTSHATAICGGISLASSVTPYEDIADYTGSQVNQVSKKVCESTDFSLGGSPAPALVMLTAKLIFKRQLQHDWLLDQHGWPVGTPEVKEHATYVRYML